MKPALRPILALFALASLCLPARTAPQAAEPRHELARAARPWSFLSAVGKRAALYGYEDGRAEAWVYPLKLLRDFRLEFRTAAETVSGAATARSIIVRPEQTTIVHSSGVFNVRQTWFVPPDEPGGVIRLEVDTAEPMEIEAVFERDLQWMWPAGLGGTYLNWDAELNAFYFGEEQRRFFAYLGSPTAREPQLERTSHLGVSPQSSMRLGPSPKGKSETLIVFAVSFKSQGEARATYRRLIAEQAALEKSAAAYYDAYLTRTAELRLPDAELQRAYDWARISVLQGMVTNPFLGTGLIAGYGTSGRGARPGFAWFFGRDSLWTAFALNAMGDFSGSRTALEFVARFQRADGKMPHEIAQSATFVDWFKDFPYGYASADATPLYILATEDYVRRSGDLEFARANWERLWKSYTFMRSTYDPQGFAKNLGVGHGWVEGGPLLPVRTELYQAGLGVAAVEALGRLAALTGKDDAAAQLRQEAEQKRPQLNEAFWLGSTNSYAFALDTAGKPVDVVSVLSTVPMWFDVLDAQKSSVTITHLARPTHLADWGSRILGSDNPLYDPTGYHFGSVWPLFTGWASVGQYRQHRPHPAYANLAANALITLDSPLGHTNEVLSGDFYEQLATSSPHQIWSAAMVISPLLRGMLGLEVDAGARSVRLAPHVPAHWPGVELRQVPVGDSTLDFILRRGGREIILEVNNSGKREVQVEFAPAFSLRARVTGAEAGGRRVRPDVQANPEDQHAVVRFTAPAGHHAVRIAVENDFGVFAPATLPLPAARSRNLKIISETWSADRHALTLEVAGIAGERYELPLLGAEQVTSVEGAELNAARNALEVSFPGTGEDYQSRRIEVRLRSR